MKRYIVLAVLILGSFLSKDSFAVIQSAQNNTTVNVSIDGMSGGGVTTSSFTDTGNGSVLGYLVVTGDISSGGISLPTNDAAIALSTTPFTIIASSIANLSNDKAEISAVRLSTSAIPLISASTGVINTALSNEMTIVATDTNTLRTQIITVGIASGTINTALLNEMTIVATDTNTLRTQIIAVGVASGTINTALSNEMTIVATDTNTLRTQIITAGVATGTVKSELTNVEASSGSYAVLDGKGYDSARNTSMSVSTFSVNGSDFSVGGSTIAVSEGLFMPPIYTEAQLAAIVPKAIYWIAYSTGVEFNTWMATGTARGAFANQRNQKGPNN